VGRGRRKDSKIVPTLICWAARAGTKHWRGDVGSFVEAYTKCGGGTGKETERGSASDGGWRPIVSVKPEVLKRSNDLTKQRGVQTREGERRRRVDAPMELV